jgi:hypothetical protein
MACFDVVYARPKTAPLVPALLLTLTILPPPCFFIIGKTSLINLTGAETLTAMTWSHSSSDTVSALWNVSMIPAMLSRASMRSPSKEARQAVTIAFGAVLLVRSSWRKQKRFSEERQEGEGARSTPKT